MNIIFLTHHDDFVGYSMDRYLNFLSEGMGNRGHTTEVWNPKPYFSKMNLPENLNKWLRYVDQFVLFPLWFKFKSKALPKATLFVLVDQALGMWMPLLQHKKHVVHCHDFIALKSALGNIKENPTSKTGKIYQRLILKGFSKANCFISVSKNTQVELVQFLDKQPLLNEQVYNALDPLFVPGDLKLARTVVGNHINLDLEQGYILHVGGNDFYKNRVGVIELYDAWRDITNTSLPLLLLGYEPADHIKKRYEASPYKNNIHFLVDIKDQLLLKAYQGAGVLVFPSLAEGFGWPVAEAMAAGCPVITTGEAPMNEVGGTAALYIKRCPSGTGLQAWAKASATVLETTIQLTAQERAALINKGFANAQRFDGNQILDRLEKIYSEIVNNDNL
tara:strand:+ start:5882 stop:7051 length:1170 start_codon:yes stop_codon:yes gene_type:complete